MATALLSLARGDRLRRPMAMTGELTLTGHVLAVGGIREKVIAARRAKIDEVILPFANRGDYEALPEYLREGVDAHFVRGYREVFDIVFDTAKERRQLH
jgi:ATP-dependent Lon protease